MAYGNNRSVDSHRYARRAMPRSSPQRRGAQAERLFRRAGLFAALLCACVAPHQRSESATPEAVVRPDRVVVTFPAVRPAITTWPAPSTGFPGYYDWRFGVAGPGGFTASAGVRAGEMGADDAHGSLEAIAQRLRLRRCEPGGHILTCAWPIAGDVTASRDRITVTLRDSSMVTRLNTLRPAFLWRSIFLADTIVGMDSVRLIYRP
jgi:hypothetical protein